MTTTETSTTVRRQAESDGWYRVAPVDVAKRLDVDPAAGLSGRQAADLLAQHGPNALPAEAQERSAVAKAQSGEAKLKVQRAQFAYYNLRAPISGRVSRYFYTLGNLVNQDQTLLTTIVSIDPMYAYFDLDERTLLRVRAAINEGKIKMPAHSTELQYVFQRIPLLDAIPPFKPAQLALSNLFISYWTRFAATGNPNLRGTPHWPRFVLAHQKIQELIPSAAAPESGSKFAKFHKCSLWLSIEG